MVTMIVLHGQSTLWDSLVRSQHHDDGIVSNDLHSAKNHRGNMVLEQILEDSGSSMTPNTKNVTNRATYGEVAQRVTAI